MSKYRIEISPSGRAGCKDTLCKETKAKIKKGEIRMGVWLEYPSNPDYAGWQWKHWGCVSGAQIVNLRKEIGRVGNGEYNWDAIDGWEDLEDHPEVQEKIKRVIKQGHIDPEDFNGDPDMNQPGQKGIRHRRKNVDPEAEGEGNAEADNENGEPTPKKATGKRGRGKKTEADDEEADEPEPPAKKTKRASKKKVEPATEVKTEPGSEPEPEPEVKPKKATKGKRGAKAAVAVKEESDGELPPVSEAAPEPTPEKPKKTGKGKRGAKAATAIKEESEAEAAPEPPKRRSGRARKIKKEPTPEPESEPEIESEVQSEAESEFKSEPESAPESEPESEPEAGDEEDEPTPKAKKGRKAVEKKPVSAPKRRGRKSAA